MTRVKFSVRIPELISDRLIREAKKYDTELRETLQCILMKYTTTVDTYVAYRTRQMNNWKYEPFKTSWEQAIWDSGKEMLAKFFDKVKVVTYSIDQEVIDYVESMAKKEETLVTTIIKFCLHREFASRFFAFGLRYKDKADTLFKKNMDLLANLKLNKTQLCEMHPTVYDWCLQNISPNF